MPTCRCTCSELIFKCYCGRPRTNVIHKKKLEILPTLVGASKAPIITPAVSTTPVAPQALLDVVSCSYTAECKACIGTRCSCNSAGLPSVHAQTTANAREETSAVVLSPASRWISKTMKWSQVSMMNKFTLYFLLYILAYRNV